MSSFEYLNVHFPTFLLSLAKYLESYFFSYLCLRK